MLSTVPSSLDTGISDTAWPASKAVGMQGASCRSCQDGLQVVCQLLHRDCVTGHRSGNIDQLALLSHQVGAEHCRPRQPAVHARTLAEGLRPVLSCRKGAQAKAKYKGKRTQSLVTGQKPYQQHTRMTCHLWYPLLTEIRRCKSWHKQP